ncbi:MAG: AI-2E family transporter [Deltaproteobacteria bacterium]|nr:AI-2E family transporter [Deltaproteobacteria bacterium]
MKSQKSNSAIVQLPGMKLLFAAAAIIIVVAGLKTAKSLLVPFMFAVFLAIIGIGPVFWMKRRRFPTFISVSLVALLFLAIFSGIGTLLATSVNAFTAELPKYSDSFSKLTLQLEEQLANYNIHTTTTEMFQMIQPGSVMELFGTTLKRSVGALSDVILVIIIVVFILYEAADFRVKLRAALDGKADISRFTSITQEVQHYLAIKTLTSGLTGLLVGVWVAFMGIDFPMLWGLVAFLLNYIPVIGSIIASVPAVLLSLVTVGWGGSLSLAIGYVVINVGVSNLLEPILMGRKLGLSPLIVFLSLVFWGWVWGPAGMLMSVPLTMIVKILLDHSDDFQWVAILMDLKPRRVSKS